MKAIKKQLCPFLQTQFILTSAAALTMGQGSDTDASFLETIWGRDFSGWVSARDGVKPVVAYIDLDSRLMLMTYTIGRDLSVSARNCTGSAGLVS